MTSLSDTTIQDELLPYGFSPNQSQCEAIRAYISLLLRWNQKISLTTVVNHVEILRFHFGESIFAASSVPVREGRLADVGSGAGFPGLALRIALPGLTVVLIEPNSKKAAFLAEASRELKLSGVTVVRHRMEELPGDLVQFDFISARALGDYPWFLSLARRALARNGKVALWLGEEESGNIRSISSWYWRKAMLIPGTQRRFLLVGSPAE